MMHHHIRNAFDSVVLAIHETQQLDSEEFPDAVVRDMTDHLITTAARLAPPTFGDEGEARSMIARTVRDGDTLALLSTNR